MPTRGTTPPPQLRGGGRGEQVGMEKDRGALVSHKCDHKWIPLLEFARRFWYYLTISRSKFPPQLGVGIVLVGNRIRAYRLEKCAPVCCLSPFPQFLSSSAFDPSFYEQWACPTTPARPLRTSSTTNALPSSMRPVKRLLKSSSQSHCRTQSSC